MAGTLLLGSLGRKSFCIGHGLCRAKSLPGGLGGGAGAVALVECPRPSRDEARPIAQPGEVAERLDNRELEALSGVRVTRRTASGANSGSHTHWAAFRERGVPEPLGGRIWRKSAARKAGPTDRIRFKELALERKRNRRQRSLTPIIPIIQAKLERACLNNRKRKTRPRRL